MPDEAMQWRADGSTSQAESLRLEGHAADVLRVVELPECGLLATLCKAEQFPSIHIFDVSTGLLSRTLEVPNVGHGALVALGKGLVALSTSASVFVWNATTGRRISEPAAFSLFFDLGKNVGNGLLVVVGSRDLSLFRHNSGRDFRVEHRIKDTHSDTDRIIDVAVCGTRIASTSSLGTTKVWDAENGKSLATLQRIGARLLCLDISTTHIATGTANGTIHLYSSTSFALIHSLKVAPSDPLLTGADAFACVCLSEDGFVVSFSKNGTTLVRGVEQGQVLAEVDVGFPLHCGVILRDGRLAAVGKAGNAIVFRAPDALQKMLPESNRAASIAPHIPPDPSHSRRVQLHDAPPSVGGSQILAPSMRTPVDHPSDSLQANEMAASPGGSGVSRSSVPVLRTFPENGVDQRETNARPSPTPRSLMNNRNFAGQENEEGWSRFEGMDSGRSTPTESASLVHRRHSVPISGLGEELIQIWRSSVKKDRLGRGAPSQGELREVIEGIQDDARQTVMVDESSLSLDEREEKEEEYLKYLDEQFPVWIRELQSVLGDNGTTEKLAAISRMKQAWRGWTVSPGDLSYDKDTFGLPIELGRGAVGMVYRGVLRCQGEDVSVAIKKLDKEVTKVENRIKFMREVLLQHRVNHPNIVDFKGAFWPEDVCDEEEGTAWRSGKNMAFIASELMTTDLKAFIKKPSISQLDVQLMVLLSVAKGLEYLHSLRIVHQDVSPDNVLLRLDEEQQRILAVKVADFGVSRVIRRTLSQSRTTTCVGCVGKFEYMAPEFFADGRVRSFPVDVWSFGVLCTFVVLRQTALHGFQELQILNAANENTLVETCVKWAQGIANVGLRNVCISCLSADPSSRPSMKDVRRALEALLEK